MITNRTGDYVWIIFNLSNSNQSLMLNLKSSWKSSYSNITMIRSYLVAIPSTYSQLKSCGISVNWNGPSPLKIGDNLLNGQIATTNEFTRLVLVTNGNLSTTLDASAFINYVITNIDTLQFWLTFTNGDPLNLTTQNDSNFNLGVLIYLS